MFTQKQLFINIVHLLSTFQLGIIFFHFVCYFHQQGNFIFQKNGEEKVYMKFMFLDLISIPRVIVMMILFQTFADRPFCNIIFRNWTFWMQTFRLINDKINAKIERWTKPDGNNAEIRWTPANGLIELCIWGRRNGMFDHHKYFLFAISSNGFFLNQSTSTILFFLSFELM